MRKQLYDTGPIRLPMLALRGLVLFPGMTLHFDVGRKRSVAALESALKKDSPVFLVTQRNVKQDDPDRDDIYEVGTIAVIKQVLKLSGDSIRVLVEGISRARLLEVTAGRSFNTVLAEPIMEPPIEEPAKAEGAIRELQSIFEEYSMYLPKLSGEIIMSVLAIDQPGEMADYVASNISIKFSSKQQVLECIHPVERLKTLILLLHEEIEIMGVEQEIRAQVKDQMDQNQREYYLREQLKAIQGELGEGESIHSEVSDYRRKIAELKLDKAVAEHLLKEVSRLAHNPANSSEASVIRSYLDSCLALPWNTSTKDHLDLRRVRNRLNKDHYGMEKVKQRILEHLAVQKLAGNNKNSQVICLVGPPGVGKTSV
ncbi:MAG: endopeptidase La, partial [Clostridiales bacterium]|nr:endopeptidase La [Clostridiales bacterium]